MISSVATSATGSPLWGTAIGTAATATLSPAMLALGAEITALVAIVDAVADRLSAGMMATAQFVGGIPGSIGAPAESVFGAASAAVKWADPLEKLFGINLNLVDDFFSAFFVGLKTATEGLVKLAEVSKQYSPALAYTSAQQEVLNIRRDISRAQTLGPGLSQFIEARGDAGRALDDIKTALTTELLPPLIVFMRIAATALEFVRDFGHLFKPFLPMIIRVFLGLSWLLRTIGIGGDSGERPADATLMDDFLKGAGLDSLRGSGRDAPLPPRGP